MLGDRAAATFVGLPDMAAAIPYRHAPGGIEFRLVNGLGRGPRISTDVAAFLLEDQEQRPTAEPHRAPTWFRPAEARHALELGGSLGEAAELARTLDVAIRTIEGPR